MDYPHNSDSPINSLRDEALTLHSTDSVRHKTQVSQTQKRWPKRNSQRRQHGSSRRSASQVDDGNSITKVLSRGAPTDSSMLSSPVMSPSQQELSRKRSQYFDDAFATREPFNAPKDRVNQDSIVIIEIKTNIEVEDRFQVLSELSFNFAQIFQRPENSILVNIQYNAYLIFGASYDPAYLATVSALPCLIAPMSNMRNTVLMQNAMNEILGIPSNRGVIKFDCVAEENIATKGCTIKDEIDQLERTSNDGHGVMRTLSRTMSRRHNKANTSQSNSVPINQTQSTPLAPIQDDVSIEASPVPSLVDTPEKTGASGRDRVIKKCKNIRHFFSR